MKPIDGDLLESMLCIKCSNGEFNLEGCSEEGCPLSKFIARQPELETKPVRHGRWIDIYKSGHGMQSWCSVCEKRSGIGGIESNRHRAYCPNCGAKMDGESDAK